MRIKTTLGLFALGLFCSAPVWAEQPWTLDDNTRYLALGDSLTAGYGAIPVTDGYAYVLYRQGIYDSVPNTTFANAAMPGATSSQVLDYQVPLATQSGFGPNVVTMTVGGNDLLAILNGAEPQQVLAAFQGNLVAILMQLCLSLPEARLYVGNLYAIRDFPVATEQVVLAFNQVVAGVAGFVNVNACTNRIKVADLYAEFSGQQDGLLLINRNGAGQFEIHPTNAGYRAIAKAFIAAQ
jgi:lysophospholipase L1-like esterase